MKKTFIQYGSLLAFCVAAIVLYTSCEKEIDINIDAPKNALVVEGHIENGLPPYVLLTKNSAFFGNIDINDIASYFVSGAKITVTTDNDSVQLQEYSSAFLELLPDSVVFALADQFGLDIQSVDDFPPIIIYTVPFDETDFVGVIGKSYDLRIEIDDKIITSTTTLPEPVFFDSLWIKPPANPALADSFFQFRGQLKDPIAPGNYYRYFTQADGGPWLLSGQTVFDDGFFNGKDFQIFIPKGRPIGSFGGDIDFETDGLWTAQDTICTVKLSMIDKAHYEFWRTLEANRSSQGNPFGSVVYVKSNVKGALGIWGGYSSITGSYNRFP